MNFTREPIIETIITPKDGHKLVIRSSKVSSQEEYLVDAVEVVSFGSSLFFRSLERPKSFLVPVSDFEVIETKETRVVLKTTNFERSIKIGGGKEVKPKEVAVEAAPLVAVEPRTDKKRERRRRRKRPGSSEEGSSMDAPAVTEQPSPKAIAVGVIPPVAEIPTPPKRFIPAPTTLISDTLRKEVAPIAPKEDSVSSTPVLEEKKEPEDTSKNPKRRKRFFGKDEPAETVEAQSAEAEVGEAKRLSPEGKEAVTSPSTPPNPSDFFGKFW